MYWLTLHRVLFVAAFLVGGAVQAVDIDLVPVGNAGNVDDVTGYGGVDYAYDMGMFEITNAQWREFLTAKARASDPHGLYNECMRMMYGGIDRTWSEDHYVYTAKDGDANWDNRPVNFVSFWDAARFCNWLHNGQGDGSTETGSYVNIGDPDSFSRLPGATWVIPTEDEWFKAAYHVNDGPTGHYFNYPTSSDLPPYKGREGRDPGNTANYRSACQPYCTTEVGEFENSSSPYGTFDQGGNLWEWNEGVSTAALRGGSITNDVDGLEKSVRGDGDPNWEYYHFGFRVARVPEPGALALFAGIALAAMRARGRR